MEVFQTSLKRLFRFKLSFFLSITCVSIISYPSHAEILTNNKFEDTNKLFNWEFTWNPTIPIPEFKLLFPNRNLKHDDGTDQDDKKEQWDVSVMLGTGSPPKPPYFTLKGQHIVKFENTDAPRGVEFKETIPTGNIKRNVRINNPIELFTKPVEHIHNPDPFHKDSYLLNYMVLNDGHIYFQFTGHHISNHPETPELSSPFSLLALGTLGAASTLKRKLKPSQSTEKETTKVG